MLSFLRPSRSETLRSKKRKLSPWLKFIFVLPSAFAFLVIILLNIGNSGTPESADSNKAFQLLSWKYSIQNGDEYTYDSQRVYLNYLCTTKYFDGGVTTTSSCRSVRNVDADDLSVIDIDGVDWNDSFWLFIATEVCLVVAFVTPIVSRWSLTLQRVQRTRELQLSLSGGAFGLILAGSILLTLELHLIRLEISNQIKDFSFVSKYPISQPSRSLFLEHLKINTTATGLMWSAVGAIAIDFGFWVWMYIAREKGGNTINVEEVEIGAQIQQSEPRHDQS